MPNRAAIVTGASSGIGLAIAHMLGQEGHALTVAARRPDKLSAAAEELRGAGYDVHEVAGNMADEDTIKGVVAAHAERFGRLDVLVNNAGVTGGMPQNPTTVSIAAVRAAVETNVIGVIRVTNAMVPLLRRSASPRIVNMSSTVGSLARQTDPGTETGPLSAAYSPSKSMLNAVTVQYAKELHDTNILINAACPGYVATDLNGFQGVRTPEQGAAIAVRLATLPDDGPTGGFFEDAGVVPW
jgi:NAD(P)-dependent dehydrogenase (short-subunit alcohol dehydrogenase family)